MRTTEKSIFKRVKPSNHLYSHSCSRFSRERKRRCCANDLLLKGGHVIDPANGLDAKMDVAVSGSKIVAVEKDIHTNEAGKVVDVSGLYVTPGAR